MHVVWIMANNSTAPYFNWFAALASKDPCIKMSFICLFREYPKMIEDMRKYGCDCYWVKYDSNYRKINTITGILKTYQLLKKIKPDIIHSHLFDDSIISLIAAKLAGIKARFITKADTGFHYFYAPKGVVFDRFNNHLATHIIPISEECKTFILEREHANPTKVHLIHHGIPIDALTKQKDEFKKEFADKWNLKNRIVVGTVARLIDWKGYKRIINAASILVSKYPNILFLFIGRGEQKKELEELVRIRNLSNNVIFINWIDPVKLPSLYGLMNIYMHAAKYEPFGFVIAEALANGVPVVSTKTGAALDAIEHLKSGYLSDNTSGDLADGVVHLLNHNPDNIIGLEGKRVAEKMYSIENMYSNHLKLYKEALSLI